MVHLERETFQDFRFFWRESWFGLGQAFKKEDNERK